MKRISLLLICFITLLTSCSPSQDELNATATQDAANRFATQTAAAPTATPTFTPTLTSTPTQTPTPTSTPTSTPEPTATLAPLNLSLTKLDGTWYGLTSEGKELEITIKNNGVSAITIGFKIPGCESYSPLGKYYGTIKYYLHNNTISISEGEITITMFALL